MLNIKKYMLDRKNYILKLVKNYYPFFFIFMITIITAWITAPQRGKFSEALSNNIHTFILGMLGLLIFAAEASSKRNFQEKQWEYEKSHLEDDLTSVRRVSEKIAIGISSSLKNDVRWASDAMEKAKIIGLRQNTLFTERLTYYPLEKEYLADQFAPILLKRCKHLIEKDNYKYTVYLIIDSGTTLYSLFAKLAEHARVYISTGNKENEWINNLNIVTNNLPGLLLFMDKGRLDLYSRYAGLAINCILLPGVPLPIYSAVTGKETVEALKKIKDDQKDAIFIGIVTGNWVRI